VRIRRSALSLTVLVAAASLALTACADNSKKTTGAGSGSNSASTSVSSSAPSTDAAAIALLPTSVKSAGKLIVGINVPYQPNEYKDSSGKIVGWEVDFLNAVAAKLGLTVSYQEAGFDNIIPSVKLGKFDLGMSSVTDNKTREQQVDFVNYYSAGFHWASPAGKTVSPDNACGLKVAVQTGTTEQTDDVPAKSKACTAAGKKAITILKIDNQDAVNESVVLGQADAFDADSPITQFAVKQSGGKLQLAGDIYGAAPYGLAVAKNSTLSKALQTAIQSAITDGTYKAVLSKWGVEAGSVTSASINGASS
jgi:polar amino acid transport system substrate-binding protein